MGLPQNRWFITDNLVKIDDLRLPPIYRNLHMIQIYPIDYDQNSLHGNMIYTKCQFYPCSNLLLVDDEFGNSILPFIHIGIF